MAAVTAGELWLAVDGLHLVRARTRLTRPVTQGLVEIERLELGFEGRPVDGAWLPRRIEVRSSVRGLVRLRAHNVYSYSEFERRIPDAAAGGPAPAPSRSALPPEGEDQPAEREQERDRPQGGQIEAGEQGRREWRWVVKKRRARPGGSRSTSSSRPSGACGIVADMS
jgi:hypothetical protein